MNIALLNKLREAGGEYVPLEGLASCGAAVEGDLDELERFGFQMERHPYRGVAYRGPAQRLCPDQIEHMLMTRHVGRRVAVWKSVASTNDLALKAAGSRANDGLVILAEEQTAGRGRLGRSWTAPAGTALLISALVFPPRGLDAPGWLTAWGAVALAEVVEGAIGRPCQVKWPNDVRIRGRKLAGILVERASGGAVIGIGLNVNVEAGAFPADLRSPATSLLVETGARQDRSALARELIERLDRHYGESCARGFSMLEAGWRARLEGLGQGVRIETAGGELEGHLIDACLRRGLCINGADGGPRWLAPSEILGFDPSPTAARLV